ncbi:MULTISPECIES: spore coat U domain-containing protein [Vreelandella]|uniref:Spore coat protein U domain-containing protein n=2 Tax=Vreelandella TaxID=3137766 RepID=A0A7C9K5W3_9GAMM|nr:MULTISPECIES: spore coat U domain-containing protein [Halomonas]NDL70361.1 spore coat protein U domain-containing protein [Halomonas alkaliphila]NYS43426.1 spore coat protein U domain-containing protein [Halomonas zhaodongensis]
MLLSRYSRATGLSAALASLALLPSLVQAQSLSGTIDASITLEAGCSIDGEDGTAVDFGELAFGTHSALFDQADAQVAGAGGITVLCSPGVAPTFTLLNGAHDGDAAPAIHAMQDTTEPAFVGYTLYTDTARTETLALNGTIVLDEFTNGPQSIDLYGRAFGDPGNLPAGTYEDTLQVQLTW